jgi:hypothetical protein
MVNNPNAAIALVNMLKRLKKEGIITNIAFTPREYVSSIVIELQIK